MMSCNHWSDKGQNSEVFNNTTNKENNLEQEKDEFRELIQEPAPKLELNPPWAGEVKAKEDREIRESKIRAFAEEREELERKEREKEKEQEKQQRLDKQQEQDELDRKNALKTEAEQKRQEALSLMQNTERAASTQDELESVREQFREATMQTQNVEREL